MTTEPRHLPRVALHSPSAVERGVGEGLYAVLEGGAAWATCVTKAPTEYELLYPDAVRVGTVALNVGPSLVEHADPPVREPTDADRPPKLDLPTRGTSVA